MPSHASTRTQKNWPGTGVKQENSDDDERTPPPKKNNYYAIGFKQPNAAANKNVTDAGLDCPNTGYQFDGNKGTKGNIAKGSDLPNDALVYGGTEYKAGAVGILDAEKTGPKADTWTIDQDKDLRHAKVGY